MVNPSFLEIWKWQSQSSRTRNNWFWTLTDRLRMQCKNRQMTNEMMLEGFFGRKCREWLYNQLNSPLNIYIPSISVTIDAHRGWGRERGTSCTPSKDFEKFGHYNAIKHENRGTHRFSHNPKYPLKRIFQWTQYSI